jgi:CheY-like chemotaxis protein
MTQALRVLHLEDEPRDSEIMEAALRAEGIECQILRVDTREQFVQALTHDEIDVIISDVWVPGFDGITAPPLGPLHLSLRHMRRSGSD